jgi:Lon protease-like protein
VPEIGLFPLELVLMPSEQVPLHIFEPRYRDLIGECLTEDREFGLLLEDEQGRREVGTRAGVVEVLEVFDDGRMNVVVEGRERFRLLGLTEGRSFLTAEVEPLEDEHDPATEDDVGRARALFRRLATAAEADVEEPEPGEAASALSFALASRIDFGVELRQELLELRSERRRLVRLVELMERAITAIERERDVRERASGNGKVSPPP